MAGRSKTNPDRFVLTMTKNNVARKSQSLSYEIVSEGGVSKIKWLGNSTESADDLVCESPRANNSKSSDATHFLLDVLADGPIAAIKIFEMANQKGISETTLNRVKSSLGIRSRRVGFGEGGRSEWMLPSS